MSQSESSLSSIYNTLPQYKIVKDKINMEGVDKGALISTATKLFHDAKQNKTDGIKFIWENKWVHLRSSNTEPIIESMLKLLQKKRQKI